MPCNVHVYTKIQIKIYSHARCVFGIFSQNENSSSVHVGVCVWGGGGSDGICTPSDFPNLRELYIKSHNLGGKNIRIPANLPGMGPEPTQGAFDGGSQCRMSILRKSNVTLSNLRNGHVTLSNLRNCHVPCHYLLKTHVACH